MTFEGFQRGSCRFCSIFPPMEKLARTRLHADFGRRRVAVRLILAPHRKRPGTEPGARQPRVSRIAHRMLPGHDAAPTRPRSFRLSFTKAVALCRRKGHVGYSVSFLDDRSPTGSAAARRPSVRT